MDALKGRVKSGRIVLDEPCELPEGTALAVYVCDSSGDSLSELQRSALHRKLERSIAQADAGEHIPAEDVLAELEQES